MSYEYFRQYIFISLVSVVKNSPIKTQNAKKLDKKSEHLQSQLGNKQKQTSVNSMNKTSMLGNHNRINNCLYLFLYS
jgi:uncharacterized protein YktB (UPF0637 family)